MVRLNAVLANEELERRARRVPDEHAERRALESLGRDLASSPRRLLQALSDTALELCHAHSAGISLLEQEGERRYFRWHAVSGEFAPDQWTTLPRDFSPCGTVLDRGETQLMIDPERYFTPLKQVRPRVAEALLVPFAVNGELVGTLWVTSHDELRRFDGEDRRVITQLSDIAASAYGRLIALDADGALHLARLLQGLQPGV